MKLCANCFNDVEVKQFINTNSTEAGKCECCLSDSKLIDFEELADFFASLFSIYTPNDDGISLRDIIQKDWELFSCSNDQIDKLLDSILPILSYSYTANAKVAYIDEIRECIDYWVVTKEELKSKKRFFSDIEEYGWDTLLDVYSIIDKQTPLYRARIHNNGIDSKPYKLTEMGCPSVQVSEGRANPKGIKYLYLSKDIETTFYETRALYLDYISVGTFHIKDETSLQITDFTKKLSPFNNTTNIIEFTKGKLFRDVVGKDLSKPIHRFDSELEYVPTQFICEFIRLFCNSNGVQFYSSLKNNGINLVLFDEEQIECNSVQLYQVKKVEIEAEIS